MARTVNGVGTTYLGVGQPDADGWRPATVWFVLWGMPVVPLRREVLRPVGQQEAWNRSSIQFDVRATGWIRPLEVVGTWILYWLIVLPVALAPVVYALVVTTRREAPTAEAPRREPMAGSSAEDPRDEPPPVPEPEPARPPPKREPSTWGLVAVFAGIVWIVAVAIFVGGRVKRRLTRMPPRASPARAAPG